MEINNVHVAYFSATYTTRTVVREIAARMGGNIVEHDITGPGGNVGPVALGEGDVMVAGVPVYAGRVPQAAAERLRRFSGNGVPAIAACVYGNRDYDDALLELADLLASGGFKVVGAGAFIGRHSIFTNVAAGRPDEADLAAAARLGEGCAREPAPRGGCREVQPLRHVRSPLPRRSHPPGRPAAHRRLALHCVRAVLSGMPEGCARLL